MYIMTDAVTIRQPAMANFMVDSADRNLQGTTPQFSAEIQAWNDFTISKGQPLLDSFARRIACVEVQFPWAIPNITEYNNTFYIVFDNITPIKQLVTIPIGFYTGVELANAVETAIAALATPPTSPIFVDYDAGNRSFTFQSVGQEFSLTNSGFSTIDAVAFFSQPSLLKTLGITVNQLAQPVINNITGITTMIRYTDFVDITSTRINYNSDAKDGTTKANTIRDYVVRIYIGNDINTYIEDPAGTRPFEIHRQIYHPKFIRMNPEQFLNSVDLQVRDQYGNLVYVPPGSTYPDYKLTFVASEQ